MLVLQVGLLGAIGGVVAASPAFPVLTNGLLNMGGPALFKVVLAIALLTGASGSGPAVRYITVHVRDIRKHGYQHECFAPCIRICISDT